MLNIAAIGRYIRVFEFDKELILEEDFIHEQNRINRSNR